MKVNSLDSENIIQLHIYRNNTFELFPSNQNEENGSFLKVIRLLKKEQELVSSLLTNVKLLFLSKAKFIRKKNLGENFRNFVLTNEPENCLKAISTLFDLSSVTMNQFKFMYTEFTLGKGVRLLIRESFYLLRKLEKEHGEITNNLIVKVIVWINQLLHIHKVNKKISNLLTDLIVTSIEYFLEKNVFRNSKKEEKQKNHFLKEDYLFAS